MWNWNFTEISIKKIYVKKQSFTTMFNLSYGNVKG